MRFNQACIRSMGCKSYRVLADGHYIGMVIAMTADHAEFETRKLFPKSRLLEVFEAWPTEMFCSWPDSHWVEE